jgi:AAHS family 4-hydroxybenzoate transporter-like MFS transporter
MTTSIADTKSAQENHLVADILDTDAVINRSRISRLQITVGVLGVLILFVDGFNTQVIGYIAPQIAKNWNISRDVLGWILAADKIGLLIGYLFVAPLSVITATSACRSGALCCSGCSPGCTTFAATVGSCSCCGCSQGSGSAAPCPRVLR